MKTPTQRIIRRFKFNVADYAVTFYKVYGRNPQGRELQSIVLAATDRESDATIRSCLRAGVRVAKAEYADGDCALTFGVNKKVMQKLGRYLA
jgi:hypothetical protein